MPFLPLKLSTLLSSSLQGAIPIMDLVAEIRNSKCKDVCTASQVFCKVFEDNAGALELARIHKLKPGTMYINVCYDHFCECVHHGKVKIFLISTIDQITDLFTKALTTSFSGTALI